MVFRMPDKTELQNHVPQRRRRKDTLLIFDLEQRVPDILIKEIIEKCLLPPLVERCLQEHRPPKEDDPAGS